MAAENVNLVTLASNFKETTLYIAWRFSFIRHFSKLAVFWLAFYYMAN